MLYGIRDFTSSQIQRALKQGCNQIPEGSMDSAAYGYTKFGGERVGVAGMAICL